VPGHDAAAPLEGANEPPGQAELLAWVAREMRRRLLRDRLWVLAVDIPLELLLLRWAVRAVPRPGRRVVAGLTVGASAAIAGEALRHLLRRRR
jgi:hypothetical protein